MVLRAVMLVYLNKINQYARTPRPAEHNARERTFFFVSRVDGAAFPKCFYSLACKPTSVLFFFFNQNLFMFSGCALRFKSNRNCSAAVSVSAIDVMGLGTRCVRAFYEFAHLMRVLTTLINIGNAEDNIYN